MARQRGNQGVVPEETFGASELARKTGVSRPTVYRWMELGLIDSVADDAGTHQFSQLTIDTIEVIRRLMRKPFRLTTCEIRNQIVPELSPKKMAALRNLSDDQLLRKVRKLTSD